MRALLGGQQSPNLVAFRHAVMLNAAAALLVAGRIATLGEGVPLAAAAVAGSEVPSAALARAAPSQMPGNRMDESFLMCARAHGLVAPGSG